jgi:hypothetical protein
VFRRFRFLNQRASSQSEDSLSSHTIDLRTSTIKIDADENDLRFCFRIISPIKAYTLQVTITFLCSFSLCNACCDVSRIPYFNNIFFILWCTLIAEMLMHSVFVDDRQNQWLIKRTGSRKLLELLLLY